MADPGQPNRLKHIHNYFLSPNPSLFQTLISILLASLRLTAFEGVLSGLRTLEQP